MLLASACPAEDESTGDTAAGSAGSMGSTTSVATMGSQSGDESEGSESTQTASGTGESSCPADLPEPLDPCLEGCGNSLGVGRPCSPGGGECVSEDFNDATLCVVDFVPDAALNQCTKPCVANDQCGEDAFCQGDPDDPNGPKGCVLIACDPEGFEMSEM